MQENPLVKLIETRVGREFEFGGYHFSRICSEDEAVEAYRLRYRVFRKQGFIDAEAYPDGLLQDEFDEVSEHVLARDPSGVPIGTMRLVMPSPAGYPTEHYFDFRRPDIDRRGLAEYGRLAIDHDHRGGARAPHLGLVKALFEVMIERCITHVYAFLTPRVAATYGAFGLVSVPLETQPPTPQTLENRRPMAPYFASQDAEPRLFSLHEMMAAVDPDLNRDDVQRVEALPHYHQSVQNSPPAAPARSDPKGQPSAPAPPPRGAGSRFGTV